MPTNMSRDLTYTTVEPFSLDRLALHDNRLRYQLNLMNGAGEMSNIDGSFDWNAISRPSIL